MKHYTFNNNKDFGKFMKVNQAYDATDFSFKFNRSNDHSSKV